MLEGAGGQVLEVGRWERTTVTWPFSLASLADRQAEADAGTAPQQCHH